MHFMCYNLGATETLISPAQQKAASPAQTYGSYYQWGRPTSGWVSNGGNNGSQNDAAWGSGGSKNPVNDPCPTGYKVPSRTQLASLSNGDMGLHSFNNNSDANRWTWIRSVTNGVQIGDFLFLPAAGYLQYTGTTYAAGSEATYWVSNSYGNNSAYDVYIYDSGLNPSYTYDRNGALSVRCVAEK